MTVGPLAVEILSLQKKEKIAFLSDYPFSIWLWPMQLRRREESGLELKTWLFNDLNNGLIILFHF